MSDALEGLTGDERIVQEAHDQFKRCQDWESTARQRYLLDIKFCEGDSENNYQWESTIVQRRLADPSGAKPCLTVNETRQHCLQIVNDARQNKAGIEIRAVGGGATYEAAKVFEGVVRHIEYISNAAEIYDSATWHQVAGGIGYWRVTTDYLDDQSFDQEIYLRRIPDPMSVYLDPDIQEYDGSDAAFGFVFRDEPRDKWEKEHKGENKEPGDMPFDNSPGSWDTKDHVRVAEYYRKSDKREKVLALDPAFYNYLAQQGYVKPLAQGAQAIVRESDLPDGLAKTFPMGVVLKERETTRVEVEWFKIAGNKIVERNIWPGIYIPLVRVVGEETVIDGQMDRKGHTRSMKDPQRMLNFWVSAAAEYVALQSKTPWLTPLRAVQGLETFWQNANKENFAYLPYNDADESGEIKPPHRQDPPQMSQAYIQGIQIAKTDLMAASGQFQAQMGQNENAKSGVAIQARQRQGDNATYHYIDHLAQAIRFTGRILIDLIPRIYDTPRVIKVMAEDGDQSEVHINPEAAQPQQMMVGGQPANDQQVKQAQASPDTADQVQAIFNPNVGKYDVVADVGPGYATRRQEQFNAMSQMMTQNPDLMKVAGDILFQAADFPMADELAERFKRMVPAAILGEGPPPELEQMQQQFKQQLDGMSQVVQKLIGENSKMTADLQNRDKENQIKDYDAETKRMAHLIAGDPEAFKPVIRQLISEALGTPIVPLMALHAHADQQMAPQEPEQVQ